MTNSYFTLSVETQTNPKELAEAIGPSMSREQIFELIKNLDLLVAEYDFTSSLLDYFSTEIAKEDGE